MNSTIIILLFLSPLIIVSIYVFCYNIYFNNKYKYFVCWKCNEYRIFLCTYHYFTTKFECPMRTDYYGGHWIEDENVKIKGQPRNRLLSLEEAKSECIRLEKEFGKRNRILTN